MSYELVITRTKKIESSLVNIGAEGKGLHEKLSSVESKLDEKLVKKIRFVASVRNNLIHDDNVKLTPELLSDFQNACNEIDASLASKSRSDSTSKSDSNDPKEETSTLKKVAYVVLGVITIIGLLNR